LREFTNSDHVDVSAIQPIEPNNSYKCYLIGSKIPNKANY